MKIKKPNLDNDNILALEEDLIKKQNNKLKKHYLKPTAKAFIHKFSKLFNRT